MNRSTGVVVVPVGIATAAVGAVQVGLVAPVVRAVAVVRAGRVVAVVLVVRAVLVVPAEAEDRRVLMVRSSPGTVRPGTKAVKRREAVLAGPCRVPQTSASMPTMRMPRAALVLRAIRASTSAALGLRRETVHRAARVPKVLAAVRHKAMADATIVAPTVVRVPRMPPVVPVGVVVVVVVVVVVAGRPTAAVDLVRADRAGRKVTDRSRRATIATGVVVVAVVGTSPPLSRRHRIWQLPRPSPCLRLRRHRCRRLWHLPKTLARPRRIRNPSR